MNIIFSAFANLVGVDFIAKDLAIVDLMEKIVKKNVNVSTVDPAIQHQASVTVLLVGRGLNVKLNVKNGNSGKIALLIVYAKETILWHAIIRRENVFVKLKAEVV